MTNLVTDLRFATRSLRKAPLFTAVAVLSIAFGIGANSAVFTLLDQVVLRAIPVAKPAQLVQVDARNTESYGGGMGDGTELSYPMYQDLLDRNQVFAGMFCRSSIALHVSRRGQSERVLGELVSGTFFPVLGVTPAVGRLFAAQEDRGAGNHPVAVLGYEYWNARFNRDPGVVGQTINVNGHPFEIIGVVRGGFQGLDIGQRPEIYLPITMQPQMGPAWLKLEGRRFRWVQVFGRLKDGTTPEHAEAGLQPLYHSLLEQEARDAAFASASAERKAKFLEGRVHVTSASRGHSNLRDSVTLPLLILMGIAAGVLLIVCANVANLLIARGAARNRELALRLAIGASRLQITRLLLVETVALAFMGTALGLVFARWGATVLLQYYSTPDNPIAVTTSPDLRITLFTAALAAATALAAGCIPALRSARLDVAPALRSAGTASASERPHVRKALVITQVSLSFLLLIGAGLFVRSLRNLANVDTGFRLSRLLSFSVDLERNGYDPVRAHDFTKALQERVSRTPGVQSAASAFMGLLEGGAWAMGFTVEGYHPAAGQSTDALCNAVTPDFFRTMGVPLLAGREFDERDERATNRPKGGWPYRAAVVNEAFVKRYFNGASPLGRHIGIGEDPGTPTPIEVVGVVADTRYMGVREEIKPQVFVPYLQSEIEGLTVYVRTERDPGEMMTALRRQVAELDPTLPVFNVSSMDERVARSIVNERLIAGLSGALSAMATLLAVVGLYGLMAYTVTRRTREIGIRMALGAVGSQIGARVLREAGVLVAIGLMAGWVASVLLGRFVESQLYGIKPADAWTVIIAATGLASVAAVAVFLPARRAASTSPMAALREE